MEKRLRPGLARRLAHRQQADVRRTRSADICCQRALGFGAVGHAAPSPRRTRLFDDLCGNIVSARLGTKSVSGANRLAPEDLAFCSPSSCARAGLDRLAVRGSRMNNRVSRNWPIPPRGRDRPGDICPENLVAAVRAWRSDVTRGSAAHRNLRISQLPMLSR